MPFTPRQELGKDLRRYMQTGKIQLNITLAIALRWSKWKDSSINLKLENFSLTSWLNTKVIINAKKKKKKVRANI